MQDQNKITDTKENKYINIEDFLKVEIKLGTIVSAVEVEATPKLYKLVVDFGEYTEIESVGGITEREERCRTVFSGIRNMIEADNLVGKQFPFVTNLAPRKIMGEYSEAMILAASESTKNDGGDNLEVLALMSPTNMLPNGTKLK